MSTPFSKAPPASGAVWRPETHKLIEWSRRGVLVTRPWPNPRAWTRTNGENAPWRPAAGNVYRDAWDPELRDRRNDWVGSVRVETWCSVPEDVQQLVVASTVSDREWSMLNLLARCPGAMDLARSVPLLAGALSVSNGLRSKTVTRPFRSARALLRLADGMARWRKIAAWLGFEGSSSFVRALRKATRVRPWSVLDFAALRDVWAHPLGRKRLCHARRVDPEVVQLLRVAVGVGYIERLPSELVDAAYAGGGWGGTARVELHATSRRRRRPGKSFAPNARSPCGVRRRRSKWTPTGSASSCARRVHTPNQRTSRFRRRPSRARKGSARSTPPRRSRPKPPT